ncbi:MAG: sigma-70 family RNA polymerase sigma factor [Acidobacteria bacterium]|nr:MAG: sigma-70 family RNA polymerase sigma factor [Acidobacteriota bacterium]
MAAPAALGTQPKAVPPDARADPSGWKRHLPWAHRGGVAGGPGTVVFLSCQYLGRGGSPVGGGRRSARTGSLGPDVAGFRSGDPAAIVSARAIAERVIGRSGYFVPPEDRLEILQDIFLALYQAVSSPRFRIHSSFGAFVRCVAHRRCVDWVRQQRRNDSARDPASGAEDPPAPATTAEERLHDVERKRLARSVLNRLRASCRELLIAWMNDVPYSAISLKDGRSEEALRQQVQQCLKEARRLVSPRYGRPRGSRATPPPPRGPRGAASAGPAARGGPDGP